MHRVIRDDYRKLCLVMVVGVDGWMDGRTGERKPSQTASQHFPSRVEVYDV